MINETRVNLKHLLEDIRDSYTSPLEEVILIELVANALDSKASQIVFIIDEKQKFLRCTDDGGGMKRTELKQYHNIAATAKIRGTGIGFAGIGAKLALLVADKVITESRGGHASRCATEWRMTNPYRAPWKFLPSPGYVQTPRGTSVTILFTDTQPHLLREDFVRRTILKHFAPLLNETIMREMLHHFYRKGIQFAVNGRALIAQEHQGLRGRRWFRVQVGKSRHPVGIGYIEKSEEEPAWLEKFFGEKPYAPSFSSGLSVSTFGKVIKGGWEWVGIMPKNPHAWGGLVEIPALSEILTTNKNDFVSDAASLKKYYKYRKAVQEAILPILKDAGEAQRYERILPEKMIKPLNKSIGNVLNNLIADFPELESLVGARRKTAKGRPVERYGTVERDAAPFHFPAQVEAEGKKESVLKQEEKATKKPSLFLGIEDPGKEKLVRARQTRLNIVLENIGDVSQMSLGRMVENTITINTGHPAWQKAKEQGMERYHILVSAGLILSQFLEKQKSPQEFVSRFLAGWAELV